MTEQPHYHRLSDLPNRFPIFPLAGALLLPRGRLPLNIFEPRYLNMIDDALSADRIIGMIQPTDPDQNPAHPPLYKIGCAGRITSFTETSDGRYLITLTGVCRYQIAEELQCLTPYRQVAPGFETFVDDLKPASDAEEEIGREQLLDVLKEYLTTQQMDTDWDAVRDAPVETLVNSLAMICPFDPQEKQALLEAQSLGDRAHTLTALLQMANATSPGGSDRHLQ